MPNESERSDPCACDETYCFFDLADNSYAQCRKCGAYWRLELNQLPLKPNTGAHADHPPVDGGYRGDAEPSRSSVIAEAMLRDAVRTDRPRVRKLPTPTADAERKAIPIWSGCVKYFPSALLEIAKVSKAGNDQHNPGQPLHWAQGKSMNQADTAMRHLLDADATEGTAEEIAHLAQAAWRVLARLQLACQREGAPLAPGAVVP